MMNIAELSIDIERIDNHILVRLSGYLNADNDSRLTSLMLQHLEDVDGGAIVECGNLEYISSAGIRALLMVGKKMESRRKGVLVLVSLRGPVRQMAEIAGLDKLFTVCETLEQAEGLMKP